MSEVAVGRRWQIGLILLHAATVMADDTAAVVSTLAVDLHPRAAARVQAMSESERDKFRDGIVREFVRAGVSQVEPRWCERKSCAAPSNPAHLRLEIKLGEIYRGQLKRGIFFDFGAGDGRSSEGFKRDLMPVSCRLRTPGGRLLAARDAELRVAAEVSAAEAVDGSYLAAILSEACGPVLSEQQRFILLPENQAGSMTRAAPGVFIEKREVLHTEPGRPSTKALVATASVAILETARSAQTAESVAIVLAEPVVNPSTNVTRQTDGKRTQYVLHNQGDTVVFEFGQHERGQ